MLRVILAAVAGAVILFVWGFVSWAVLSWHDPDGKMPGEDVVISTLRTTVDQSGVYFFPAMPQDPGASAQEKTAALDVWTQKHREGPIGMLVVRTDGAEPMEPIVFVKGVAIYFAAALLAAILLVSARGIRSYVGRVAFVALLGLFTGLTADLNYWNWLFFPTDYSIAAAADHVIGWLLVGLVMAAIIKAPGRSGRRAG